jgi:ribosomal protein S18 acetylase RimI-like enzyme
MAKAPQLNGSTARGSGKVRIRAAVAADAPAIARVHVETWRSAYRGIVPPTFLAGLSVEERTGLWHKRIADPLGARFVFVVEVAEALVGFAAGGPERSGDPNYPGELHSLYVLPSYQRHGLGRALVHAVAARLATTDTQSMLLWVLEANAPARSFYERLGGTLVRTQPIEVGGSGFTEVAYGWPRLDTLVDASRADAPI